MQSLELATFWFGTFVMLFRATRSLAGHETLEDEWYVVIKACKLTVFEILRNFLYYYKNLYCVSTLCLHVELFLKQATCCNVTLK